MSPMGTQPTPHAAGLAKLADGGDQAPNRRWDLWLLTAAWIAMLLGYGTLFPLFESPDEIVHIDLILHHEEAGPLNVLNEGRFISSGAYRSSALSLANNDPRLEADAVPRPERPSLVDIGRGEPSTTLNRGTQQPTLYYYVIGNTVRFVDWVLPGDPITAHDRRIAALRVFAALLQAPVPLLFALIAREMGGGPSAERLSILVLFLIPQLAHIGGAINNDDSALVLMSLATLMTVRLATRRLTMRSAVITGLVIGVASLSKGTALPALTIFGIAGPLLQVKRFGWPGIKPAGAMAGAALIGGGWFWIVRIVRFGQLLTPVGPLPFPDDPAFEPRTGWYVELWFRWMAERFFGWFGYFDVRMSSDARWFATAVLAIGLLVGLSKLRSKPGVLFIALTPLLVTAVGLFVRTYLLYASTGVTAGIQGRYIFLGLGGFAAVIGLGAERVGSASDRTRWFPAVLFGTAAVIVHGAAIRAIMDNYWEGATIGAELRTLGAWAPFGAGISYAFLIAAAMCIVGAPAMVAVADQRRSNRLGG